jgi:hypothetical protein
VRENRSPYAGARVSVPAALIAAGWVGLWSVWPTGVRSPPVGGPPRAPRVHYVGAAMVEEDLYTTPTLFGRSSRVGFAAAEPRDVPHTDVAETAGGPSRPLEWSVPPCPPCATRRGALEGFARARLAPSSFRHGEGGGAPASGPGHAAGLRVAVSATLRDSGLRLQPFPETIRKHVDGAWSVTAVVETDEDGVVRHVFVEAGTDDPRLNALVERTLYRATLTNAGVPRRGRVEVAYEP